MTAARVPRGLPAGIVTGVDLGFRGELVEFYHRYRHGYPGAVIDVLADLFGLNDRDVAVDLGCGTGQLTLALAGRVRAVLGVDPEPDMLRRARQAADEAGTGNVSWMLGADTDMPAVVRLLGGGSVTISELRRLIGVATLDPPGYFLLGIVVLVIASLCMLTSRIGVYRILNSQH